MASVEADPIGQERVEALRRGLREFGWVEGRNLQILLRWSGVDAARIQEYTAELVHLAPDLIVANATPSIAALKRATQSIPLVFVVVNDPVAQGIVSSVARPEGNITGFSFLDYSVVEKSLELLKEVAPGITRVAVMFNPETYPYYNVFLRSFEASARRLSVEVTGTPIRPPSRRLRRPHPERRQALAFTVSGCSAAHQGPLTDDQRVSFFRRCRRSHVLWRHHLQNLYERG
jgi:putative ABC transport system substrate-binding protein